MTRFLVLFVFGFVVLATGAAQDWHVVIALGGYLNGLAFAHLSTPRGADIP